MTAGLRLGEGLAGVAQTAPVLLSATEPRQPADGWTGAKGGKENFAVTAEADGERQQCLQHALCVPGRNRLLKKDGVGKRLVSVDYWHHHPSTDQEARTERRRKRGGHRQAPDPQEFPEPDIFAFAADRLQPEDGGKRSGDRQIRPEIDTD